MFIRHIHYLITLAQARHFARAANLCNVSQPTLSTAIRHLEEELGVALVRRGQRFQGLTPEGERVLVWARRILADWEGLKQEAATTAGQMTGLLRIGAIPTAMSAVPLLSGPIRAAFPGISQIVLSLSAEEILRRLKALELDIGITYREPTRARGYRSHPLYQECHVLIAPAARSGELPAQMSWAEAAALPLCLLTGNMQNRRTIDAAFQQAGASPRVAIETDSVFALYSYVRRSGMFSVVPRSLLFLEELRQEIAVVPLTPLLARQVEALASDDDPPSAVLEAAWSILVGIDVEAEVGRESDRKGLSKHSRRRSGKRLPSG